MKNTVDPNNFNVTLKGYIIKALENSKLTVEQERKLWNEIRFSLDSMDMEEAREYYYND